MKMRNVSWNLFGLGVPLALALICIPLIIKNIGLERFGLLSLAWGLMASAGVFDLGIGRATTQHIARLRGLGRLGSVPQVLSIATRLTAWSGCVGALLLMTAAALNVQSLSRHTPELDGEVTQALVLLALILPIQAVSATYRGVNEAFENFRAVSLVRIFVGAMNLLGPLLVSLWTSSLPCLVGALLLSRCAAIGMFHYAANRQLNRLAIPHMAMTAGERRGVRRRLFRFGGWISVSGILSPLMLQSDRFVIAAILSASAVATYTLPYELIVQSLVIVGAVSTVAFPSITRMLHQDVPACLRMFRRWTLAVTVIMAVTAACMAIVLPAFLPWWVGNAISPDSVLAGQILCIGVLANAVGSMYYALLHAMGKSRHTATLHLVELSIYVVALPLLIHAWGIIGAALAWTGRMIIDAVLLIAVSTVAIRRNGWHSAASATHRAMSRCIQPSMPLAATRQSTP